MKKLLLIAAIVPWLTSGCKTQQLWDSGFVTCTTPGGAKEMAGYHQPVATKNTDGGIVLEYDAVRYRLGMFGGIPARSKWKLQRMTSAISTDRLLTATNADVGIGPWSICPPAINEQDFVSPGQTLPVMHQEITNVAIGLRNIKKDVYPASECLLDAGRQWVWYIPPRYESEPARAAVLSKNTQNASLVYLPVKLVMLPITVSMDVVTAIVLPIALVIEHPDLH